MLHTPHKGSDELTCDGNFSKLTSQVAFRMEPHHKGKLITTVHTSVCVCVCVCVGGGRGQSADLDIDHQNVKKGHIG